MPRGLFIDANLLVLFVVGLVSRRLINRHRRTREFTVEDYDRLAGAISLVEEVLVTPNTLTEASNLLGQHGEPERSSLLLKLGELIGQSREVVVASAAASRHASFARLGLTDSALLTLISAETPLVTVDLDLYSAALTGGEETALNFNHFRFA